MSETMVFHPKQKLWWMTSRYGHKGRVPVEVVRVSKSGKRVFVSFQSLNYLGLPQSIWRAYVDPRKLESRHE